LRRIELRHTVTCKSTENKRIGDRIFFIISRSLNQRSEISINKSVTFRAECIFLNFFNSFNPQLILIINLFFVLIYRELSTITTNDKDGNIIKNVMFL